jgi:hypothetical protein
MIDSEDSRIDYYVKFCQSIGVSLSFSSFVSGNSIPSQSVVLVCIIPFYSCDEDLSPIKESFVFEDFDSFGRFLMNYCRENNLEFKPYKKDGRGGKRLGTGGKREGAGHPKGVPSPGSGRSSGFGKYGEEGGKMAWIPAKSSPQNIEDYRTLDSRLSHILQTYRSLALQSQDLSVTGRPTRDWTKAMALLNDLQSELDNLAV